jgi:Ca2+-transporting ATPase
MEAPWSESTSSLLSKLGTSQDFGLSSHQIAELRNKFGKNVLQVESSIGPLSIFKRQINNPMTYTLLIVTIISITLGDYLDASAIFTIVILNGVIGFTQEYKAEASIQALKKLTVPKARVLREGKIHVVKSEDVLPGDILQLEAGDYVVADARITEAYQFMTDESVLTGESLPVEKKFREVDKNTPMADRKNMIYAGTAVNAGSGKAVVTSIGMNTELGRVAGLLKSTHSIETPLQKRLLIVSNRLLLIGVVVIFLVVLIGIAQGQDFFTILMASISLAVAAIPEGLLTVVTLAQALAVKRMSKRKALVRRMSAIETLGSTDIICTDKTGTLTTGKMKVREVFTFKEGVTDESKFVGIDAFFNALIHCNNASLYHGGSGDATEIALLKLAQDHNVDIEKMKKETHRIHEWSFDSDRKRMTVAIKSSNGNFLFCKGAPESVLPLCKLSSEQLKVIHAAVEELSNKGRRMLAVGWKSDANEALKEMSHNEIEHDFDFLGLVAMADPPKEGTIPAIKICKEAGIKVAMITGDHPTTACAIARELEIVSKGFNQVITGIELNQLSDEELLQKVETTAVYARVTPEHKLKIIEALQANGHIVSMTGDGVNDAPALKKASIGVAMGMSGTEVARQASSMILTNDEFSSIVSAVEEGRAIFGNIQRTIQYLFSTNLAEIFIMLGAVLLGLPVPLTPLALLWINLVTDGFPSLALAAEPVPKNFLQRSHQPSPDTFFDKNFMREMFLVSGLMTVLVLIIYQYSLETSVVEIARSRAFTILVYLSLFRSFSCRSENKTFFEMSFNPWHLASVAIPIGIQLSIQHTELYQRLFKVHGLSFRENIVLFLISLLPVTVVEISKFWRRK